MDNKTKLDQLIKRNEDLGKIIFIGFDTSEELEAHRESIPNDREEYYRNFEEIKSLKWELMTPEERKRQEEIAVKLEKKRGNKTR